MGASWPRRWLAKTGVEAGLREGCDHDPMGVSERSRYPGSFGPACIMLDHNEAGTWFWAKEVIC
jgi:hypothetical protein